MSLAFHLLLLTILSPILVDRYVQVIGVSLSKSSDSSFIPNSTSGVLVNHNEEQLQLNYNCALLHICRTTLATTSNIFFCTSLALRFFHIVYADFGYVINGRLNTNLNNLLYGLFFIVFTLIPFFAFEADLITNINDDDQLQKWLTQNLFGAGCSRIEPHWETDDEFMDFFVKPLLYVMAICFISEVGYSCLYKKAMNFAKAMCPDGKYSAFGGNYRRNVLSFRDISNCCHVVFIIFSLVCVKWSILYKYKDDMTNDERFLTTILFCITFDLTYMFYYPWKWLIQSMEFFESIPLEMDIHLTQSRKPFYVRQPNFEPQRYLINLRKGDIFLMLGSSDLNTIQEDSFSKQNSTQSNFQNWKTRLRKVPVNGKLYTRKKLEQKLVIPPDLEGLPGWEGSKSWNTHLVEDEEPENSSIMNIANFEDIYPQKELDEGELIALTEYTVPVPVNHNKYTKSFMNNKVGIIDDDKTKYHQGGIQITNNRQESRRHPS